MLSERSLFLHILRFLSAVLVCAGHAKEFYISHSTGAESPVIILVRGTWSLGTPSVLAFFFLSGYLVGGNELSRAVKGSLQPRKYFLDRLSRLWLVLLPALILTKFLTYISCEPDSNSLFCTADTSLASHSFSPPLQQSDVGTFIGNILFLQPFRSEIFSGNSPLWSLSYEFWFYIVFYFFLIFLFGHKSQVTFRARVFYLSLTIVGMAILSLNWLSLSLVWISGAFAQHFILFFNQKLFYFKEVLFARNKLLKIIMFVIMPSLVCAKLLPSILGYPILVVLLTSAIALTSDIENTTKSVLKMVCIKSSEMSFSLYLIHFPILALISTKVAPRERWEVSLSSFLFVSSCTALCILLAYFFAVLTEFRLRVVRSKLQKLYGIAHGQNKTDL